MSDLDLVLTIWLSCIALLLVCLAVCYHARLYRWCEPWFDLVIDGVPAIAVLAAAGIGLHWCPDRWYVNGVRTNGAYECRPVLGDPERDVEDARDRRDLGDERVTYGAIYCTGGMHAIVTGPRTVGCQR